MRNLILIFVVLFSFACNDADKAYLMDAPEANFEDLLEVPVTKQVSEKGEAPGSEEITKKVIRTGSIEFQSKDVEKDYNAIAGILSRSDAYIENENQSRTSDRIYYNLTIRVPADHYDSLFKSLTSLAFRLDNKSSNIQDVTERYYDLKTRLKNKKALEERYLELLKKANAMKDILEIEQKISEVRTEIENLEGQFRYLSKQIGFSTINLSFYQELPFSADSYQKKGFVLRISDALSWGWQGFLSFLVGTASLWPFIVLTIAGIYLFRRFRHIKKEKGKTKIS